MEQKSKIVDTIKDYKQLCEDLPSIIERSGRKHKFFYENLGISRSAWNYKLKKQTWEPEQLEKIIELI